MKPDAVVMCPHCNRPARVDVVSSATGSNECPICTNVLPISLPETPARPVQEPGVAFDFEPRPPEGQ